MDSRAERTGTKKRPDIICYHKGLLIGIELSYSQSDAERDAEERIKEHIVDVEIAVWLKEHYNNMTEEKLDERIKNSKFDIKVLTEMQESLLPFLEQTARRKLSLEGWFINVSLYDLKDFIENSVESLIKEEKVKELAEDVRHQVNEFTQSLSSFDTRGLLAKIYYDQLWRLYGFSLGKDYMEIKDVVFGQVALSILLSSAFASARVSVSGTEAGFIIPKEFDILIMNPPFTRATGRSARIEEGRNAFFGFIADKEARKAVKKSYEEVRKMVRQQLLKIANEEKQFPKFARNILERRDNDLQQYRGIGQAGEGLLFLYLSYKYIKFGGIIALVLPRNILAGIHWFLARTLLASKFSLRYVIVSADVNGNNFSQSTSIGEVLLLQKNLILPLKE